MFRGLKLTFKVADKARRSAKRAQGTANRALRRTMTPGPSGPTGPRGAQSASQNSADPRAGEKRTFVVYSIAATDGRPAADGATPNGWLTEVTNTQGATDSLAPAADVATAQRPG